MDVDVAVGFWTRGFAVRRKALGTRNAEVFIDLNAGRKGERFILAAWEETRASDGRPGVVVKLKKFTRCQAQTKPVYCVGT